MDAVELERCYTAGERYFPGVDLRRVKLIAAHLTRN
jgi:hypothetical protein